MGGGEETEVFSGPIGRKNWALSRGGIYYFTETVQGRRLEYAVEYFDIESGQVTELFRREGPIVFRPGLAVSPDEQWILYNRRPLDTSELMLVENFR